MKKKHGLNLKEAKILLSTIFVSIVFKIITPKDIDYEDGKIQNIAGIEFENNEIIMKRNIYDINTTLTNEEDSDDKKLMSDNWKKYLTSTKKIQMFILIIIIPQ